MRSYWIVELGAGVAFAGLALAACVPALPSPSATTGDAAGAVGTTTGSAGAGVAGSSGVAGAMVTGGAGAIATGFAGMMMTGVGGSMATGGAVGSGSGGSTCTGTSRPTMPPPFPLTLPTNITQASTPLPAISGGTLLALADKKTAVASDPERDRVNFIDLTTNTVRATVALQAGDEPGRVVEDGDGRVHVVLRRGGAIATFDPGMGTLTARRAVCSAPRGMAYQSATKQLQIACAGGELVSLPPDTGGPTRTLTLDRDLRDVVVGASGSLLVSTFRKAEVLVVDSSGVVTSRLQPGSGPVLSFATGQMQMRTPSVAWRMVSMGAESGNVVMLHQTGVVDTVDPSAGGYAGVKGCGAIVQPGVSVLRQSQTSAPMVAGGLNLVSLAVDVAVSPDSQKVAIAVPGNAAFPMFPAVMEAPVTSVTTTNPCAGGPTVPSPGNAQAVAVAYTPDGVLLVQTREPATVWRRDSNASISLATDARVDTGHLIFHANAGGGIACASCHPEGGEDGRVWTFACQGARRTQSIRGGISATAPFHWDGGENDISRLMDDVFTGRMAGPALSSDQKRALQNWVDTIPALPQMAGLDGAAVARGQALFNDPKVACASCHAGTLLTNNSTVDVGTGGMFQVPSLRGVSWRAPFMHSGCAASFNDRFGAACGGDKHGATSTLTTSQLGDLTAYLESL
ncbi:MAG TPA: cytochrome-c peroxidase [Polyangia bacterium]